MTTIWKAAEAENQSCDGHNEAADKHAGLRRKLV